MRDTGDGTAGMVRARFRLELPPDLWIAEVSRSFPQATFRLLAAAPAGDRSLELGEVLAEDPRAAVDTLHAHPAVVTGERLHVGDGRALSRYETTEQRLFEFLGAASLSPEFPLGFEDGWMEFTVTATRDAFEALGDRLDAAEGGYELLSVVQDDDRSAVLTDRQRECLAVALRRGYFEIPSEATLAEVAAALDVDKSSASETLRRGTARVLDWFFVDG